MNYERFCPQIHGICRDGFPEHSTILCSMWDTVYERCIFVDSMLVTADMKYLIQQQTMKLRELKTAQSEKLGEGKS